MSDEPNRFVAEDGDIVMLGKVTGEINMLTPAQRRSNLEHDRIMREAKATKVDDEDEDEDEDDRADAAHFAKILAEDDG